MGQFSRDLMVIAFPGPTYCVPSSAMCATDISEPPAPRPGAAAGAPLLPRAPSAAARSKFRRASAHARGTPLWRQACAGQAEIRDSRLPLSLAGAFPRACTTAALRESPARRNGAKGFGTGCHAARRFMFMVWGVVSGGEEWLYKDYDFT